MPTITPWKAGNDLLIPGVGWVSLPEYMKKGSRRDFLLEVAKFAPLAAGGALVAKGRRGR